jgi:lauroyl/myristoyl acyltransferase
VLYRIYRFCEWLASWLPARAAYAIARVTGVGIFLCSARIRRTLIANQRRLRPTASRHEIARNARLAAITVAKNYYDLFRLPSMSKERILEYFDGRDLHYLKQAYARGKGVIVVAPHMGSYSLVPSFASCLGYPSVAVVERIRDERLHNYFLRLRANHGLQIFTTGQEDVRNILRAIRNGHVVMMLSDRNVGTSRRSCPPARRFLPGVPGRPSCPRIPTVSAIPAPSRWRCRCCSCRRWPGRPRSVAMRIRNWSRSRWRR